MTLLSKIRGRDFRISYGFKYKLKVSNGVHFTWGNGEKVRVYNF